MSEYFTGSYNTRDSFPPIISDIAADPLEGREENSFEGEHQGKWTDSILNTLFPQRTSLIPPNPAISRVSASRAQCCPQQWDCQWDITWTLRWFTAQILFFCAPRCVGQAEIQAAMQNTRNPHYFTFRAQNMGPRHLPTEAAPAPGAARLPRARERERWVTQPAPATTRVAELSLLPFQRR